MPTMGNDGVVMQTMGAVGTSAWKEAFDCGERRCYRIGVWPVVELIWNGYGWQWYWKGGGIRRSRKS